MLKLFIALFMITSIQNIHADNQTPDISTVYGSALPFDFTISEADFSLPDGIQSFAYGVSGEKILILTGRINGLHGFSPGDSSFPPNQQNTNVYVVDLKNKKTYQRSLLDESSFLSQTEVDSLSVSSAPFTQVGKTLYVIGGYGIDTNSGVFSTKDTLSAIDIDGLIHWVVNPSSKETAKGYIKQISDPIFQVTGGYLNQDNTHTSFVLIFGQNYQGSYSPTSDGAYTEQVRRFRLIDNGKTLAVFAKEYKNQNADYHRYDGNVVPIVQKKNNQYVNSYVALSGVFTPTVGVWTVPVFIDLLGNASMADPDSSNTFKQGMNNYTCANAAFFSKKTSSMYISLFGGISYQTCADGICTPDAELPFTNNVTMISIPPKATMKQYLMNGTYPTILSTFANPGNPLLFGTSAQFIPSSSLPLFSNNVISIDGVADGAFLGYIIGGIQSSIDNTFSMSDSAASPYIFSVFLKRN